MCYIYHLLMRLLFNAILTDLLESKSKEERAMYQRAHENSWMHLSCNCDFKDKDSVFHDEVNTQVMREVERKLKEIGPEFLPRFFKICELSGFPPGLCDLSKGYVPSLHSLISHLTDLSMELRETDVESKKILGLLKAYEKLQSIFNMGEVKQFLSGLSQEEQDGMMLQMLGLILNVESFEFKLLKVRAYMCLAQTEEDLEKLRLILAEVVKISSHIVDDQIHWDSEKAQKLAYLHYVIPLFSKFLDVHMKKSTTVPHFIQSRISEIGTTMHCFVQKILSARDGVVYEEIYKSLPDSSIIPCQKSLLTQFLKENVTDRIESLRVHRS